MLDCTDTMNIIATLLCGHFLVVYGIALLSGLSSFYRGEGMAALLLFARLLPFAFVVFALHSKVTVWKVWVTVALFVPLFAMGLWNIAKLSVHTSYSGGLLWEFITLALPLFMIAAVVIRLRRQREGANLIGSERPKPEPKVERQ